MKKTLEDSVLIMLIAGGLCLDSIVITKGVAYSQYHIVALETGIWWQRGLIFAIAASILAAFAVRMAARRRVKTAGFSFIGVIVFAVIYGMLGTGYKAVIYALQNMIIASYVLICYGTICALRNRFQIEESGDKRRVLVTYLLIHVLFIVICSWWPSLHRFYIRPTTVAWMASAFMIAYWEAPWSDKSREYNSMSRWRKVRISIGVIFVQTLFFSAPRIWEIFFSFQNPSNNIEHHVNWLIHRWRVFHALTTGSYFDGQMDPYILMNLPSFHITWLGIAFERWLQGLYILIVIGFLSLLAWMYRIHREEPLFRALTLGVIISNVLGIICELNLFYSTPVSVMTARQFQMIPLICLIFIKTGTGIRRKASHD